MEGCLVKGGNIGEATALIVLYADTISKKLELLHSHLMQYFFYLRLILLLH